MEFKQIVKNEYEERNFDILSFNNNQTDDYQLDEKFYIPFLGNPNAKILTCNINPCKSEKEPSLYKFLDKKGLKDFDEKYNFLSNFYDEYYIENEVKFNLGFDRKQLMFLAGFDSMIKCCNLNSKGEISDNPNKEELKKFSLCEENQRKLFLERLQLELIPFFSNKFQCCKKSKDFYDKCFESLLNKIQALNNNEYIILLGKVYEEILDMIVKTTEGINEYKDNKFRCKIYYYKGHKLLVAPSFQGRATQSYVDGYKYGQFCGAKLKEIKLKKV